MKGLILTHWLVLSVLPAANMNCSKASNSEKNSIQINNEQQENVIFKNQKGTIHIYVCTRGCYQYVLETELNGKKYKLSPDVLDDAFKKDKLTVIFSGKTSDEMVDIKKPAPNDVPIFDFKASKIFLESIKVEL